MSVETPITYTVLAELLGLAGLLVRVLVKSDARWEKLLEHQADQIVLLEQSRDYYKALWEDCVRGISHDQRR